MLMQLYRNLVWLKLWDWIAIVRFVSLWEVRVGVCEMRPEMEWRIRGRVKESGRKTGRSLRLRRLLEGQNSGRAQRKGSGGVKFLFFPQPAACPSFSLCFGLFPCPFHVPLNGVPGFRTAAAWLCSGHWPLVSGHDLPTRKACAAEQSPDTPEHTPPTGQPYCSQAGTPGHPRPSENKTPSTTWTMSHLHLLCNHTCINIYKLR